MSDEEMIDMGFGIMITKENKAKLDAGLKLANETGPALKAKLMTMTVAQLKDLCRQSGIPKAGLRGLTVKAHFVEKLLSKHTEQCLKAAGYVQGSYTFKH